MSCLRSEGALSQAATPTFLRLPVETRKNIYKRVLAIPHPLFLFQGPQGPVETFAPQKPRGWLALLYTNRQISDEASAILYGMNQFTLEEMETQSHRAGLLESFLRCIGPGNAASLFHLCINFPALEQMTDTLEGIKLREDGQQSLELLQKQCVGLKTLEIVLFSQNAEFCSQDDQENIRSLRDVLLGMDMHFRSIASLNKIVLRVCSEPPAPPLKEFAQELGWVVLLGNR
ncbi:hypothetical protein P170DRAFT_470915 [Aspergillus steynii IBT 23096]|uniref:Uncharacterized protein n=1 Tax=Aspergillus steynii IBT 23096 TaxID=1392250 RepID=A0A2I2GRK1_9EURO|nr:uncharacterized protein P170DRAFT_470915 [Aspergillus steynii IBT 23096]PLB55501.1 hypothetical protein P170DRAFT_470915 [Aspergillus steynii IBT 23096]